jgi:hypothetical protein
MEEITYDFEFSLNWLSGMNTEARKYANINNLQTVSKLLIL